MRLAVQRALRDYEPGPAEWLRRWFAAERTGASPMTIEHGYQQDPAFWVHGAGTPDAVCVVFYGEPDPDTMHVFGPVGVAALVVELEDLGETLTYEDVFCEAAMQLEAALHGKQLAVNPVPRVGPQLVESDDADEESD